MKHLHLHPATVIRWVDADTVILVVKLDYYMQTTPIRHRLLWVDAYEKNTARGKLAIKRINALAPVGSRITVRSYQEDGDDDSFGRFLAEVYIADESINQWLLKEDLATPMEYK